MQYEDRIKIPTPEGVEVELTLAGIGSRFIAAVIDTLIKAAIFGAAMIVVFGIAGVTDDGEGNATFIGLAILFILSFLIWFGGYDVLFETLASGRTPGKRWTGLRVVKVGGSPVGFMASATRNVLRLVDFLPSAYAVGLVSIGATRLNQRLGDIAAGTLVVREQPAPPATAAGGFSLPSASGASPELASWDVSAIGAADLLTIRRFLERRHELAPAARAGLATELANRLRPKVAGAPEMPDESFLEQVSLAKAQRA